MVNITLGPCPPSGASIATTTSSERGARISAPSEPAS